MTDSEVEELLNNLDITKTEDRDAQEVVGYYNALDLIIASFEDIQINSDCSKKESN